jgi:DNA repair protein RadC
VELFSYLIGPEGAALLSAQRQSRWIGVDHQALRAKGLGEEEALRFLACLDFARRMAQRKLETAQLLNRPDLVTRYVFLRHARGDQEVLGALFLDTRNRLIADEVFFRGTLDRAHVDPKPVLKRGLELDAAGFVLFHTHPSGDPAPSSEDLHFTRQIADAAKAIGLEMHDHLIVGATDRWVSMQRRGSW